MNFAKSFCHQKNQPQLGERDLCLFASKSDWLEAKHATLSWLAIEGIILYKSQMRFSFDFLIENDKNIDSNPIMLRGSWKHTQQKQDKNGIEIGGLKSSVLCIRWA